jgi:hypothetical protein
MRSKKTAKAAKAYIDAGWRVLLTHGVSKKGKCTCGKSACSSVGKHPIVEFFPHGVKDATNETARIELALQKHPEANLAIALDVKTVVDIDGPDGATVVENLNLQNSASVSTGRGRHLYFAGELAGGTFKLNQLDVLTSDNRYVIAPPSKHPSGARYVWEKHTKIRSAPNKLAELRASQAAKSGKNKSKALVAEMIRYFD